MKTRLLAGTALFLGLAASAFGGRRYSEAYIPPPPPPRYGVIGVAPGAGFVWIEGFWDMRGAGWIWVPGRWVRPPRPRAVWVPGYWAPHHSRYRWHKGYWR